VSLLNQGTTRTKLFVWLWDNFKCVASLYGYYKMEEKSCKRPLLRNLSFPSTQPELVKTLWQVFLLVHRVKHQVVQHLGPVRCSFNLQKSNNGDSTVTTNVCCTNGRRNNNRKHASCVSSVTSSIFHVHASLFQYSMFLHA
jgi:hypothetical protein